MLTVRVIGKGIVGRIESSLRIDTAGWLFNRPSKAAAIRLFPKLLDKTSAHGNVDITQFPLEQDHAQVMVNVVALVDLTHKFIPGMLAKGEGAVINLSSSGAFQPMPYMAVYGASKAFVLSFSEALWAEYRHRGLRVLALCPGPTATRSLVKIFDDGSATSPQRVVAVALKALEDGRNYVIPGLKNYWLANSIPRLMPRSITVQILERITRPRRGDLNETR